MSTNTTSSLSNPFIGPRSFETGEKLYGRERELRDLLHLLIAERIVLLYSPSGAGKSSLIKAALIPALEKKDFEALPPIRVNQELPAGAPDGANRYVYSTLLSLEERLPAEKRLDEAALAALSLPDYLQQRALPPVRSADHDPVLIFDQFEEVLTADPTNLAAKHAFFEQLGQALSDRQVWALFAMREDYLAALDPYLVPIPNRFKDTFRLDLLGADAARLAMQGPAKAAGVLFSSTAAARLADDLRHTTVQRPDGTREQVLGPHVEPVQLQVVCLRLWERRFAADAPRRMPVITPDDITDVGDVDSALAGYYTDRVQAVAAATGVKERAIRDWVDRELITPQGQRSQVMREPGSSAGLDNRAVMGLIDAHLVRGDERHGTIWFELAHDRLVAPIQQNNAAWRMATLTPFQRQALLWEEQGRGEGLLLQGDELAEGEQWAEAHAAELTEEERAFLDACRKARAIRQEQERANRRIRLALVGAVVAAVIAIGLAGLAYFKSQEAERESQRATEASTKAEQEARIARVRQLVARAQAEMEQKPQLSLLLALTATQSLQPGDPPLSTEEAALTTLLSQIGGEPLPDRQETMYEAVFSPDGKWLAGITSDGLLLRQIDVPEQHPWMLEPPQVEPIALMFSPDGRWLIARGATQLRLWRTDRPQQPPIIPHKAFQDSIASLISPDGRWLASRSNDGYVQLWHMQSLADQPRVTQITESSIIDIVFHPDGLVLLLESGIVRLWRFDRLNQPPTDLQISITSPLITSIFPGEPQNYVFSSNGRQLAVVSDDGIVQIWQLATGVQTPTILKGTTGSIQRIVFSPDNIQLASLNEQGQVRVWNVQFPDRVPIEFKSDITAHNLMFSPDNHYLADYNSIGVGTIQVWNTSQPKQKPILLRGHDQPIEALNFSSESGHLTSIESKGSLRIWDLNHPYKSRITLPLSADSLSFSQDGKWLITNGKNSTLWQLYKTGIVEHHLDIPNNGDYTFTFSPNSSWVVASSPTSPAQLWKLGSGMITPSQVFPDTKNIFFSPDELLMVGITRQKNLRFWKFKDSIFTPFTSNIHINDVDDLKFSPDGHLLIIASQSKNMLSFWNTENLNLITTLQDQTVYLSDFPKFSSDMNWSITRNISGSVQLWNIKPTGLIYIDTPKDTETLTFIPNLMILASRQLDNSIRLWYIGGSRLIPIGSPIQNDFSGDLQFSPDGKWLSITQAPNQIEEGTIAIWRVDPQIEPPLTFYTQQSRGEIHKFSPDGKWTLRDDNKRFIWLSRLGALSQDQISISKHTQYSSSSAYPYTNAATFSQDGKWLALTQSDSTVNLLLLDQEDLSTISCSTIGRNLSLEEWQQYISFSAPYQRICPKLPYHPTAYLDLLKKQQIDQALQNYEFDIRNNPMLDPPAIWLAKLVMTLMNERRLTIQLSVDEPSFYQKQAISAYKRAFQIDPLLLKKQINGLESLCFLGINLAPEQVIMDTCDYAVQKKPADWQAHAFRAKARGKSGDLKGAREDLEQAQQLIAKQADPQDQHPMAVDEQKLLNKWLEQLKAGQNPFKEAQGPTQ